MPNLLTVQLRAANYYLTALRQTGSLYDQGGEALKLALAMVDADWSNIDSKQSWVATHANESEEIAKLCTDFPDVAPRLLDLRQHPRERIRWLEAALSAAGRLKDNRAEGRHLNSLGLAHLHLGNATRAIELFQSSLEIFRDAGDRRAEGEVLSRIGNAHTNLGEPSKAIQVSELSLEIAREQNDFRTEGIALCNLGQSFYLEREFRRAIEFYQDSLTVARKIGYLPSESIALNYLGKTYAILNRPQEAIVFYEQALIIAREIGDRQGERNALGNLGQAYYLFNETRRAIAAYEDALFIAREIGDPLVEAEFLNSLGDAYLDAGNSEQAIDCYQQRLEITCEIGRRRAATGEQLFHEWSLQRAVKETDDNSVTEQILDTSSRISWLHISDFHLGGSGSNHYNENIVIESLLEDIAERIELDSLRPDFIAVTGDLASRGKSSDYDLVRGFFDQLLRVTGLPRQRLFVVPGNHDVDRDLITRGALAISKGLTDRDAANMILASPDDRRLLFARFKGYSDFINDYFNGHLIFNDECYFYVHHLNIGSRRIAILGLNSSWLAASDEDKVLKLVIGERQTHAAINAAKEGSVDLKIALLHHPGDWIRDFDQSYSMARLLTKCDFILHGHLHKAAATHVSTPDGAAIIVAGGACYDTREHPNSYNFVRLNLESSTGAIYFREYVDEGGFWAKGVRLYKNVPDGIHGFALPRGQRRVF